MSRERTFFPALPVCSAHARFHSAHASLRPPGVAKRRAIRFLPLTTFNYIKLHLYPHARSCFRVSRRARSTRNLSRPVRLKAPSLLSLALQDESLDIVLGIKQVLNSSKAMASQDPLQWPTVQLVRSRVKDEEGGKVYQGSVLSTYSPSVLKLCADEALSDLKRLEEKLKERLEWSDTHMLRAILAFLNWREGLVEGLGEIKAAVELIVAHFREPLEAKGVSLCSIQDEV